MAESVQQSVLKRIYELFVQGHHNDIELVFQDGSMSGSKLCVTALSTYFEAMLNSDMLERNTGVIKLPTICSATFQNILKCYFLGENVVNELNWFPLLEAAEMMQLDHLKFLCLDYLNSNLSLTIDNCVDMWRSLKAYCFEDLATKAFEYMIKHAERLSENESIMSLSKSEYIELLSQDDLSQKEDDVLRDVQIWTKTNNPSVETMVDLFKLVRFKHVTLTYLHNDVIFTNIRKEHEEIQQLVLDALNSHPQTSGGKYAFTDNRILGKIQDVMFVLNDSIHVLAVANLTDNTWYELPPAPHNPGAWFAGAVLGESHIYITGGWDKKTSVMMYKIFEKEWKCGPDLKDKHAEHCMAVVDDKVYVIGGQYSNNIEQLQHGETEWQVVGDLGCKRQYFCAEAIGQNILVMGGIVNDDLSTHLQCFNTSTHAVSTIETHILFGFVTRSCLAMPNLYLVHYEGDVGVFHVKDSDPPSVTTKRVRKHDEYGYLFGFVYRDGNIIVVTENGFEKLNLDDGSKRSITFQSTPSLGYIFGTLNMHLPLVCLQ